MPEPTESVDTCVIFVMKILKNVWWHFDVDLQMDWNTQFDVVFYAHNKVIQIHLPYGAIESSCPTASKPSSNFSTFHNERDGGVWRSVQVHVRRIWNKVAGACPENVQQQ